MVESVKSENDGSSFSVSLIAFWVKGSITLDDSFLHVNMPNTILFGLLPAGKNKDTSPLSGITNVYTSKSYKLGPMIVGLLIAFAGLSQLTSSFTGALLTIAIGVVLVSSGIKTSFTYERSGITKIIEFPFFEANHVDELETQVTEKLAEFQDDRNVRKQTDRTVNQGKTNAANIVDAISNNKQQSAATATTAVKNQTFCTNCGAELQPNVKFCPTCGSKIN